MNLHDLPECHLPEEEHKKRLQTHLGKGAMLEESVRNWDFNDHSRNAIAVEPMMGHDDLPPMANMYSNLPFGAANTVELAGCVCFVSYYILKDYSGYCAFSFEEWVEEVVKKGYRAWKFKNYPGTFTSPTIDPEEVKAHFEGKLDLTCCDTKEDLIEKLGEPVGIGGSMYLIDNVIAYLNGEEFNTREKPVEHTRLISVEGILTNISSGLYVPMRVNNAIYHNDPERKEGHYVTLYGVQDGTALVWDSSIGEVQLPFRRLMNAAVADKNLIAVWDLG